MQEIIINNEFRDLLPPLDPETFRLLTENILEHGLREPLIIWKSDKDAPGTLIDGHNRYRICTEHNIPFRTSEMAFDSREKVLIWIINTQVSRRNLTPMQLSYFRGLHYQADKQINGHYQKAQNGPFAPGSTAKRLSEQYNVSRNTIKRDAKLADAINLLSETSPEAKAKILSGEIAIDRNKLEALNAAPKEEIEAVATLMEEGAYVRRTPRNPASLSAASMLPEIKQLNGIIRDFANNFNSMCKQLQTDDKAELKPVLRTYIDQLEDLYRNM